MCKRSLKRRSHCLYEEVLGLSPDHPQALHSVGVIAFQCADYATATGFLVRSLAVHPHNALALYHLGCTCQALEQHVEALDCYERAIALQPNFWEVYSNRGTVQNILGHPEAALESFDRAISLRPHSAQDYSNRAAVLRESGRLDEALKSCRKALEVEPGNARAHYNLGNILVGMERPEEALASYDAAIASQPEHAESHLNRGVVLRDLCRVDEAISSFEQAITLNPNAPAAYFNESLALLLRGDFTRGWHYYEARWLNDPKVRKPNLQGPEWSGETPEQGATLLLYAEQGLGDTLQFCRYAILARQLFARVVLEVQAPLARLLCSLPGVEIIVMGEARPAFDYHCPLMSMPRLLKTELSSIPFRSPYIAAEPDKVLYWREKLGAKTRPRVGLVWNGGFRQDRADLWAVNKRRNLTLEQVAELRCDDLDFFSLQKGEPAESELLQRRQEVWPQSNLHVHTDELRDFADTAALIANLDVVISVDTSTAHLAAAMGKPVWILNRYDTCWRWLLNRTDSPWYPNVRIYRQQRPGDWDGVIRQVMADLLAMID